MIRRILNSSIHSLISRFFITATNLFIVFFISKKCESSDLGTYGILFFFFIFVSSLSSMNLYLFFGKETARLKKKSPYRYPVLNELVVLALSGLALSLVLPVLVSLLYSKVTLSQLILASLAGYLLGLERNLGGIFLGTEKMGVESVSNTISFLLVVVPMILFTGFFSSIGNIFALRILAYGVVVLLKIRILREYFRGMKLRLRLKYFTEAKYYWFMGLADSALREADVLILSFFIDESLLGAYFLALRIYYAFGLLSEVVSSGLTPFLSRFYVVRKNGGFRRFSKYAVVVFLLLSVFFAMALFLGRHFIVSLFSPKFLQHSAHYLGFLALILLFRFPAYITGTILTSSDKQKIRFRVLFSASLLLVILDILLGASFQIAGVLISRAVTEILIFVFFGYFVYRMSEKGKRNHEIPDVSRDPAPAGISKK